MIYVASSWRNEYQPTVVRLLRGTELKVYDFKDDDGFHWSEIDPEYENWTFNEYNKALYEPPAIRGFGRDWQAMQEASCCVLVLPCGRSAHLEAGWFIGKGKPTAIFIPNGAFDTPELMYKMADYITGDVLNLVSFVQEVES